MNRRTGRRSALLLAGISALAPLLAHSQSAPPKLATASTRFSPSDKPLVLTRTVRRQLPGGKEIVAARSYAVQIQPYDNGFVVDGHLIDSQVEAPPQLAALAEIERSRPDTGLFPIILDRQGMISSLPAVVGMADGVPARQKAAELTGAAVSRAVPDPDARMQATAFVRHIRNHGAGAAWPEDLFHPRAGASQTTSQLDSGSGQGVVSISIESDASPADGLMRQFRRTVVTELDDSTRTSSEEWTLTAAR